jgi:hypothetical protein
VLCVPLFVCLLMSGFSLYESVRVTERERERNRVRQRGFFATKWVVIESDEDRDVGGWVFLSCVFCRVSDLVFFLPPMAMLQWE